MSNSDSALEPSFDTLQAVSHSLADHADIDALMTPWNEHLDATRLGDFRAQHALGIDVDEQIQEWHKAQDDEYLECISRRHNDGRAHWTGKSIAELVAGAAGRTGSARDKWPARTCFAWHNSGC